MPQATCCSWRRVISLLSPTCPYCQAGHGVLKTVFDKTASSDLKAFLVWLPMRAGGDQEAAARQAATFTDPRLAEGWDGARASVGADQKLCLDPSRFSREVLARLDRKG